VLSKEDSKQNTERKKKIYENLLINYASAIVFKSNEAQSNLSQRYLRMLYSDF